MPLFEPAPAGATPDPRLQALLAETEPGRWLEGLLHWLREASPRPAHPGEPPPRTRRLQALTDAFLRPRPSPEGLQRLGEAWGHASGVRLLAETGLPDHPSFLREGFRRLVDRAVPRLDPAGDLYALLERLRLEEEDARWLETLPTELRELWAHLLRPDPEACFAAAELTAVRAAALGISRDLLALDPAPDASAPFLRLPAAARALAAFPESPGARHAWPEVLHACRRRVREAERRLEAKGVSMDLLYRLELLEGLLDRTNLLLQLGRGEGDGFAFAALLLRETAAKRSVGTLARRSLQLLARRVAEHTGQTGEHYLAGTRAEWRRIAVGALGGGALTVLTALGKYGLAALPLAPAILGLAHAGNYAVSFWALQLLGLTLASKQPAMTAAALARALERGEGVEAEMNVIRAIARSQAAATAGNVLAALPLALLGGWLVARGGSAILGPARAEHALEGLHPFRSGTALFAAVTGLYLWISSLATGWAANWSAYRRLPTALATDRRIQRALGRDRARALGRFVRRHFGGLVGYGVLGLLLGFLPAALAFLGLHLEVRHVTLQAASMGLAVGELAAGGHLHRGPLLWALAGLALTGLLNFGVSFALAFRTALRARNLDAVTRARLRSALLSELLRRPWTFAVPPAQDACADTLEEGPGSPTSDTPSDAPDELDA